MMKKHWKIIKRNIRTISLCKDIRDLELWETTLDPERRVLKKVEIEDARLASEVTELLMGSDVAPRRNFIHEHAREAVIDA